MLCFAAQTSGRRQPVEELNAKTKLCSAVAGCERKIPEHLCLFGRRFKCRGGKLVAYGAQSVLLTNRNTTAISVLPASHSTMAVRFIGIAPTTTLEPASVLARVRNEDNAPVQLSGLSSSTATNRPGNVPASWPTRPSSPLPMAMAKRHVDADDPRRRRQ